MARYAIILAGGDGTRAGGEVPKQFHELLGIPMFWWSVRAFYECDSTTRIIVVMHPGFFDDWDIMFASMPESDRKIPIEIVAGGRDRIHSTINGLMAVDDETALVAIHDAARPLLDAALVGKVWETVEKHGSAVPCVPEVNSLRKRVRIDGKFIGDTVPVDRSTYLVVQTPQAFRKDWLDTAFRDLEKSEGKARFTDDASIVQASGYPVVVCEGHPDNFKVTTPSDFAVAEALLKAGRR